MHRAETLRRALPCDFRTMQSWNKKSGWPADSAGQPLQYKLKRKLLPRGSSARGAQTVIACDYEYVYGLAVRVRDYRLGSVFLLDARGFQIELLEESGYGMRLLPARVVYDLAPWI